MKILNAHDECMATGASCEVTYNEKSREFSCEDNGRGIPLEKLKDLCEVLNSSGKFAKGGDHAYTVAGGTHGIGLKLPVFLSDYFEITVQRDGKSVTRYYEDGLFVSEKKDKSDNHGTFMRFKVSDKYLKESDKVTCALIMKMIEEKADACPGFKVSFKGVRKDSTKVKQSYVGLNTQQLFEKYCNANTKVYMMEYKSKDTDTQFRVAFGYDTKAITELNGVLGWCNFIRNKNGGAHVDAVSEALYNHFKNYMWKSYLSERDKKELQLKREDVRLGLSGVLVLLTNEDPEYQGQYKERIESVSLGDEIREFIEDKLDTFSEADLKSISSIIRDNIKTRMASIKAKTQVRKVGTGLSPDAIKKYFPKKLDCETSYTELYIVEGDSAGAQVEAARFPWQAIYRLRGRVDGVYDATTQALLKKDIISDLSRILGIYPGKKSDSVNIDDVYVLSDADPDGFAIRSGVITIIARAFPQIIEEGHLYIVEPPLLGFKDNGVQKFVATHREYASYLQSKFSSNNDLYYNDSKFSKDDIKSFLLRNEDYLDTLKKVAKDNSCESSFAEIVCANISTIGITKNSVSAWDKMIKKNFSDQFDAKWNDDCVEISGIRKGYWQMIELSENFLNNNNTKDLLNLMKKNLNHIFGYKIKGSDDGKNLSLSETMKIFDKYSGKGVTRFKGIGEMDAKDLRDTCLDPMKDQRLVQITTDDIEKSWKNLALWNSQNAASRDARKQFVLNYVPDFKELST